MTTRRVVAPVVVVLATGLLALSGLGVDRSGAATSTVVVTATVPSASNVDASACATGASNRTDFGAVLPGSSVVTGVDCTVAFGSSNDTASLRVSQLDGQGSAMWLPFDGPLDPTWGTAGTTTTDLSGAAEHVWSTTEAPDGTIYAVGDSTNADTGRQVTLARYSATGVLVPGFGTAGVRTWNQWPGAGNDDSAWAVALQPDGKVLASWQGNGHGVVRVDGVTGANDPTFGTAGVASWVPGVLPKKLVLAPDGSMYAVGTDYDFGPWRCGAIKLTAAGAVDTSWGSSGLVTINGGAYATGCDGAALQPDGKLLLGGYRDGSSDRRSEVVRLTTSGALDTTFNGTGIAPVDRPGQGDEFQDVALGLDGTIYAAGGNGGAGSYVASLTSAGTVNWAVVDAATPGPARDVVPLPDGRVATTGNYGVSFVARYTRSGVVDTTFSSDGHDVPTAPSDQHENGTTLLHDGRLLIAGSGSGSKWQLSVYRSTPLPDYVAGSSSWSTGASGMFGACQGSVGVGTTASPTWPTGSGCTAVDGAAWNDVPTGPETVATSSSGTTTASASLRFGMRTATSARPGTYDAPVLFTVVAPAVP